MAKTKTPFFSMGAQGSVGGSITAQKKASETLLRGKPLPTDPYSLPQAYQRWLYQDYAYLWRQQSEATKAEYRSASARHHLTAFQYWMRIMLRTMPDIAAIWHIDKPDHTIVIDHSPNNNHGTVVGASPASGLIDGALSFDGLNDLIDFGTMGDFGTQLGTHTITIVTRVKIPVGTTAKSAILGVLNAGANTMLQFIINAKADETPLAGALNLILRDEDATALWAGVNADTGIVDGQWHTLILVIDAAADTAKFYLDGILLTTTYQIQTTPTNTANFGFSLYMAARNIRGVPAYFLHGTIDWTIIYLRELDQAEVTRHSARSYLTQ